jgi:hypothetical protein
LEVKRVTLIKVLLLASLCTYSRADDDVPFTRVFDTVSPLGKGLSDSELTRTNGWKQVPEDTLKHAFSGDAVVMNDKLLLLMRKTGPAIYSKTDHGLRFRADVSDAADFLVTAAAGFNLLENNSGAVKIEEVNKTGQSVGLRFRLTTGEPILEIEATESGTRMLHCNIRHVVVQDYFGDDVVYGPNPPRRVFLPAENFCLNLLEGGDAILMCVWQAGDQEEALGSRDRNTPVITFQKEKRVWLAFLEGPGIWHAKPEPETIMNRRIASPGAEWKPPFPAKWRSTFIRTNTLADSWDTAAGPSLDQRAPQHQGPLLTYLMDRTAATPLTVVCPTDIMRNTLGVGPCQYILACEGLGAKGDPTPNSVMGWVEKQFEHNKQKKVASDIQERLSFMTQHVADARVRIQRYAQFAARFQAALADQSTGAELFRPTVARLQEVAAAGLTPAASPERARQLADQVSTLVPKDNVAAECQRLGEQLRELGAIQDRALARSRMTLRMLRAQARTLGENGFAKAVAQQVQQLAEEALR